MDFMEYKGYIIQTTPYQLAESLEWEIKISIRGARDDKVLLRSFSASNSYPSREEAIRHCFDFGQRIIDGQVDGSTVADL